MLCLVMSGVEVTKEQKQTQAHICESCMNTVVQSFTHMQDQIIQLKQDKQIMHQEIKELEEKLAKLQKQ